MKKFIVKFKYFYENDNSIKIYKKSVVLSFNNLKEITNKNIHEECTKLLGDYEYFHDVISIKQIK